MGERQQPANQPPPEPQSVDAKVRRRQRRIHHTSLAITWVAGAVALLLVIFYLGRHGTLELTAHRELIPFLLSLVVLGIAATVVALQPERGDIWRLVATAVSWSFVLLIALAVLWWLIDTEVRTDIGVGAVLTSQAHVDAVLSKSLNVPPGDPTEPYLIPTGVLIQSVEFLNPNNVQVSGYIWQKYAPEVPADIVRGFVLPEAVTEAYQADQAYQFTTTDGATVIGWYFHATLRQAFRYGHYPFDRQDIALRLWHRDFGRRVLLAPDLASYDNLDPAATPGLSHRFVYGGWTPEYSGFSYDLSEENTSFGYPVTVAQDGFPELYFNLGIKRDFLSPFFDYVNFSIIVALLLFAVVCLTAREEETKTRFGISTFGVLGSAGTLLFAVLLKHSQLRATIAPDQIAYLEVLPGLLNFGILLASINAILLASPLKLKWLEYRNNMLADLLYWPLLFGLLFGATIIVFFA